MCRRCKLVRPSSCLGACSTFHAIAVPILELQVPGSDAPEMGILAVKLHAFTTNEVTALGHSQPLSFNRAVYTQHIRRMTIPQLAYHVSNLGIAQQSRFQHLEELQDLERTLRSIRQRAAGRGDDRCLGQRQAAASLQPLSCALAVLQAAGRPERSSQCTI